MEHTGDTILTLKWICIENLINLMEFLKWFAYDLIKTVCLMHSLSFHSMFFNETDFFFLNHSWIGLPNETTSGQKKILVKTIDFIPVYFSVIFFSTCYFFHVRR